MTPGWRVVGLMLGALLAAAPAARSDDVEATARELNRAGLEAYGRGEHEAALRNFEKAYALKPDGKVRLNMALACENLMRLDDAAAHYEAFVAAEPTHAKAAQARKQLADLKGRMKQWGKLVILVSPAADAVSVGGRTFTGDSVSVWVPPGQYALTVDKAGHVRHASVVRVEGGARIPIRVELQPAPVPPPPDPAPNTAAPVEPVPVAPASPPPRPARRPVHDDEDEDVRPAQRERPGGLVVFLAMTAGGAGVGVALALMVVGFLGCLVAPVSLAWPLVGLAGTAGAGALAWLVSQRWLRWRTSLLMLAGTAVVPTLACAVPTQLVLMAAWASFQGYNRSWEAFLTGDPSAIRSTLLLGGACFSACMLPAVPLYLLAALTGPLASALVANEFGEVRPDDDGRFHWDLLMPPSASAVKAHAHSTPDDDG